MEETAVVELGTILRLSYGTGHVLNDICASMWFTYLLVFFHLVLRFSASNAGLLMLVGQVADAICTPFVGLEVDRGAERSDWPCSCLARLGFGHRKTWHLIGTLCTVASFPFIFFPCIGCEGSHEWAQLIYFSSFIVIFQFGWAAVQISHLSLIPHLSPHEHQRTKLIAVRYSFTVISNILVYVTTWAVLHLTSETTDDQVGPQDMYKFQHIVAICLAIGISCSIFFHCGTTEPTTAAISRLNIQESSADFPAGRKMSPKKFLMVPQFYQVALVYMCTRLFANLSQVYMPLYLHDSLKVTAEELATVPLVMFLSSFVFSFFVGHLNKFCGRKISYLIGGLLGGTACILVYFGSADFYLNYGIYGVASLFGASSSVLLVTSLGVTADLIGADSESGAFVYGSMSFSDKLSNGLAVTAIQSFKCLTDCPHYYRNMLSFVCGGAVLLGVLATLSLVPRKLHNSNYNRLQSDENEVEGAENLPIQEQ